MLSTFKILFKITYFWKVMQSGYESWIVRRRYELIGIKIPLVSNRCRKVTGRYIKIFAAYELFRIFWFFTWYNSNKNRTCIAIVTRRWSEAEITRNSVKFYAISNETLFYPCEFNGVFLQFECKKYISEFWKIFFSFHKYSWLLFYANIILTTKLSNVWRDVNFMRTSNSPLRHMYTPCA